MTAVPAAARGAALGGRVFLLMTLLLRTHITIAHPTDTGPVSSKDRTHAGESLRIGSWGDIGSKMRAIATAAARPRDGVARSAFLARRSLIRRHSLSRR